MRDRSVADPPITVGTNRKYNKKPGSEKHYFLAYVLWRKYKKRFAEPLLEDYGYGPDRPYLPASLDTAVSEKPVHAGGSGPDEDKDMWVLQRRATGWVAV